MISLVVTAALPGRRWRTVPATHPYTTHGLQIDVADGDDWVEIGECGLAAEAVLGAANLDPRRTSGLAMGLGLDRLLPVDAHARAVVAEAGSLDVSFNLIARGDVQGIPLAEMTTADFVRPITTGITTTFITARAAARHMVAQGSGVILALNSGSAHGSPMMGGTGPADAAIDTYIRNLAAEIGPSGVRVLGLWAAGVPETLTPEKLAAVNSDLQLDAAALQGLLDSLDGLRILRRSPRLAQVADVAAFLASDQAAAITATFTNVTGMFPS